MAVAPTKISEAPEVDYDPDLSLPVWNPATPGIPSRIKASALKGGDVDPSAAVIRKITTVIAKEQMAALHSAPAELVPAPGAGKMIVFLNAILQYKVGASIPDVVSPRDLYLRFDPFGVSIGVAEFPGYDPNSTQNAVGVLAFENSEFNKVSLENLALTLADDNQDIPVYGPVSSAPSVAAVGVDYAPGDTFGLGQGLNSVGAQGVVDTVDGSGGLLTYHLTDGGHSYTTGYGDLMSTSGIGSGATLSIVVDEIETGSASVTVWYDLVDVMA